MRIIVVADHAYVNGGLSKVAIESAVGLAARGHRVDFFAAIGPASPELREGGVSVTLLDQSDETSSASLFRFGLQWLWNVKALRALKALIAGCDPKETIVHVHGWSKALSPSIGWALAKSGVPAVHTMHDFSLVCPNGGFYDYHASGNCGLKPMTLACIGHDCDSRGYNRKLLRVARYVLMKQASGFLDSGPDIITISALQREAALPYLPRNARLHSLSNPIAVTDQGPKPASQPLGDFLFVGRLSPEKGPELFAEAARQLGIPATFVGDGPLAGTIRTSYPESKILGWKRPDEVRALIRKAKALIFPSVWMEGQPLVVNEALALGTPVITSDICSAREAVHDGINGFLFASGNAGSLAERMACLMDDTTARMMADAAYKRYWNAPLTLDRHLDGLTGIYDRVAGRASGTAPAKDTADNGLARIH